MAKTASPQTAGATLQTTSSAATRLDPAHVIHGKPDEGRPDEDVSAPALEAAAPTANQMAELQQQAAQLAEHLQARQSDVERREAEFNARMAEMDNDIRRARLWLEGRQSELDQREAAIEDRDLAQELRLERVMSAETVLSTSREKSRDQVSHATSDLDRRQIQLDEQTSEIARRRRELESDRQRFEQWKTDRLSALRLVEANIGRHRASVDGTLKAQRAVCESSVRSERQARRRVVELKSALAGLEERLQQAITERDDGPKPAATHPVEQVEVANNDVANNTAIEDALRARLSETKSKLESRQRRIEQLKAELAQGRTVRRELDRLKSRCEQERRNADEAERLVADEREQLATEQARLTENRLALEQAVAASRRKEQQQREQDQADLQSRYQQIERMDRQISTRNRALEQLRDDLSVTQRETLEMRLATEEVWTQLCGRAAPAILTHTLGEVRVRLADHYHLATTALDEKRGEVERLSARLSQQLTRLKDEKKQLHQWVGRRESEIELQAARLVAREQQLDDQETDYRNRCIEHQAQRREDRAEIRRLLGQLRRYQSVGAV